MRHKKFFFAFFFLLLFPSFLSLAQQAPVDSMASKKNLNRTAYLKDTVNIGLYITSLYDFNLSDNSFTLDLWLWFNYNNRKDGTSPEPLESIEVSNAKDIQNSLTDTNEVGNHHWDNQKMKITVKKEWDVSDFPFDKQHLKVVFEESLADTSSMLLLLDKEKSKMDKHVEVDGWDIKDFHFEEVTVAYDTDFGDPELKKRKKNGVYSGVELHFDLERKGWNIFFEMFVGVYVAFMIALLMFFVELSDINTRTSMGVGALFAAIGNKYVVDGVLPQNISNTLVDTIHVLTFFYILLILFMTFVVFELNKNALPKSAFRVNYYSLFLVFFSYLALNIILISLALVK